MRHSWDRKAAVYWLDGFRCQSHFWAFVGFIAWSAKDIPSGLYCVFSVAIPSLIGTELPPPNHQIMLEFWPNNMAFARLFGKAIICAGASVIFRRALLLRAPSVVQSKQEREDAIRKYKFESKLLNQEIEKMQDLIKLTKQFNKSLSDVHRVRDEIKGLKTELVSAKRSLKKLNKTTKPKAPVNDLFDHHSLPIANLPTQKKPKRRFFQKSKPEGYDF